MKMKLNETSCFQSQKGHIFETETDTEVVAKLIKHLYDNHKDQKIKLRELVELTIAQLVSSSVSISLLLFLVLA